MGMIEKLKLLFKSAKPAGEFIDEIKGARMKYKTIPFWVSVLGTLISAVGAVKGLIPPAIAVLVSAGLTAGYNILRGVDKASQEGVKPSIQSTEFWVGVLGIISTQLVQVQTAGVQDKWVTTALAIIGSAMALAQNIGAQQPKDVEKK